MTTLQERFPPHSRKSSPRLLAEDSIFEARNYAALAELDVVHQEVAFSDAPLAVLRRISLAHPGRPAVTVQIDVALLLHRAHDAADLLFDFARSFERPIPTAQVWNTADSHGTGDFGLAWSWSGGRKADVIAFVRHNALVMLQGHQAADRLDSAASQIDTTLRGLSTDTVYTTQADGFFSAVRRAEGDVVRVLAKGRLPLASAGLPTERHFFVTDKGSVNRDPQGKDAWYYRAGIESGRQEILLFRMGAGILPVMERLTVDVE